MSDHLSFTTENSVWYIPLKYIYFGGQLNFVVTRLDNIPPTPINILNFWRPNFFEKIGDLWKEILLYSDSPSVLWQSRSKF